MILKQTKISPAEPESIQFQYSDSLTSTGFVTIAALEKLAAEQLISVKAQVAKISGTKKLQTQYQGTLHKKLSLGIPQPPSSSFFGKIINVNTLTLNKTYEFKNLRLKLSKNEKYLNTATGEEFVFIEIMPVEQPCANIEENVNELTTKQISGKILGSHQAESTLSCISCKSKVIPNPEQEEMRHCESCKLIQLIDSCHSVWYMHLLVQPTDDTNQKLCLDFNNQLVKKLISILVPKINPEQASQKDISLLILKRNKTLNISYDTITFKVIEIDL